MSAPKSDFVDGPSHVRDCGDARSQHGAAVHLYAINRSMQQRVFYDADGELLVVRGKARLPLRRMGRLAVAPGEIALDPARREVPRRAQGRGARGYVCENYGAHFPPAGPGADRLQRPARTRATFWRPSPPTRLARTTEWSPSSAALVEREASHSPLDVVAWHGNYYPYKYDLARFNAINTVSFDHRIRRSSPCSRRLRIRAASRTSIS
jgi:homogentisate 1,2-dioxygenase